MKLKTYLKLLIPLGIIAAVLRMVELILGVEASTGFYVSDSVWPTIFNVYCVLVCVFFIVMFFFMPREKKPQYRKYYHLNKIEKIVLMIASVLILAAAIKEFITVFIPSTSVVETQSAGVLDYLNLVFAVLVVFFSVLYATAPKLVVKNTFFSGFSAVFPVYYVIRMFCVFTDSSSILSHAYGTYSILFYSITALFFMNFSKMLAGMPAKRLLFLFGMGSIFFGAVRISDLILALIPGNPFGVPSGALTLLSDVAITVAEIFILIRLVRRIETREPATATENHITGTSANPF